MSVRSWPSILKVILYLLKLKIIKFFSFSSIEFVTSFLFEKNCRMEIYPEVRWRMVVTRQ